MAAISRRQRSISIHAASWRRAAAISSNVRPSPSSVAFLLLRDCPPRPCPMSRGLLQYYGSAHSYQPANCTTSLLVENGTLPRMTPMEILQLILNVIGITGVTSLALICYLLKRDNRALATEVCFLREQQRRDAPIIAEPGSARSVRPPLDDDDISQYVAQRARRWAGLFVPAGN